MADCGKRDWSFNKRILNCRNQDMRKLWREKSLAGYVGYITRFNCTFTFESIQDDTVILSTQSPAANTVQVNFDTITVESFPTDTVLPIAMSDFIPVPSVSNSKRKHKRVNQGRPQNQCQLLNKRLGLTL